MLASSKGQLQIQETIIVIFIFMVMLGLGMIFFYKFQIGSIEQDQQDYRIQKFDNILLSLPTYPEIECSIYGVSENCVDVFKLAAFSKVGSSEYYKEQLGFKNITVYQMYPNKNNNECNLNVPQDCGVWNVYYNEPRVKGVTLIRETPVSLYYPATDSYGIGLLVVEAYNV